MASATNTQAFNALFNDIKTNSREVQSLSSAEYFTNRVPIVEFLTKLRAKGNFVSSLGREKNTTNENDKSVGNNDADENRMDEELASSSLAADVSFRRGKAGRVGMKTVHPRGQKRKEQEANVEVLSSQLSSALETKKRKTGGIRLDYFDWFLST